MAWATAKERWTDWLWLLFWGVASSAWCVTAGQQLGATFDEPLYVERGLEVWRTGSHSGLLRVGTMPLPVDVETLPLFLWERWHGVQIDPVNRLEHVLPWARAGTLVFWWLLLIYGGLAGRALAGPWGGRLAVSLLACEPSLLAHAGLATTDLALTACILALVYHFRTGREAGWKRRLLLPGFWFAAAVLAKASGLVFGPLCLVVVELERLVAGGAFRTPGLTTWTDLLRQAWAALRPMRRDLLPILGGGMALVFLYCGCDWEVEPSFVRWAHELPDGPMGRSMVWISDHLRIFSNAGVGIVRQIKHNVQGHSSYVLGRTNSRSLWYYFPVVLSIKLSLPLLLAPVLLAAARPRALLNWAFLAALALLAFSLTCRVQIGVRLVMPLIVLAIIGLSAATVEGCRAWGPGWRRRLLAGGAGAALTWTAWSALAVWPDGLCYVNELWGGTEHGYVRVSEANYDWGQGLKELARWQRQRGVPVLDVWYFGSDPQITRLPMRWFPLHAIPMGGADDVAYQVRGHYLAVSTSMLYGSISDTPSSKVAASYLRKCRPVGRTATFLIYDFTHEGAGQR
jgi:hypothetical protein